MQEKKLNVATKTNEIFNHIVKNGFNNVQVDFSERESTWHKEYAIFLIRFRFPVTLFWNNTESEYERQGFDEQKFFDDFNQYLDEQFPNCRIKKNNRLGEYEILGPDFDKFYNEHFEDLEDIACNHKGYYLYEIE